MRKRAAGEKGTTLTRAGVPEKAESPYCLKNIKGF